MRGDDGLREVYALTIRTEPGLKDALRTVVDRKHRTSANMLEVMIRDYCGRNGVTIPEQGALFDERRRTAAVTK